MRIFQCLELSLYNLCHPPFINGTFQLYSGTYGESRKKHDGSTRCHVSILPTNRSSVQFTPRIYALLSPSCISLKAVWHELESYIAHLRLLPEYRSPADMDLMLAAQQMVAAQAAAQAARQLACWFSESQFMQ